jgi:hypothetical protein
MNGTIALHKCGFLLQLQQGKKIRPRFMLGIMNLDITLLDR